MAHSDSWLTATTATRRQRISWTPYSRPWVQLLSTHADRQGVDISFTVGLFGCFSFTPGLKPTFSTNPAPTPSPRSFTFPPRLPSRTFAWTVSSEIFGFWFYFFVSGPCARLSWSNFERTLIDRIVSYRIGNFVFVRLRISPPMIKLAASNSARRFFGVLGTESPILGSFAPQKAQNRTSRSLS